MSMEKPSAEEPSESSADFPDSVNVYSTAQGLSDIILLF
jgi:hypothetical protein